MRRVNIKVRGNSFDLFRTGIIAEICSKSHRGFSQPQPPRSIWFTEAPRSPKVNDLLFAGPNLVPKIFDIIRSRFKRYFLLCDISKAFLRLQLIEKYCDYVKIILREDWTNKKSKDVIYRFRTVLFGSTSSPFLLQATIQYHLKQIFMEFLLENLFVDDTGKTPSERLCQFTALYLTNRFSDSKMLWHFVRPIDALDCQEEILYLILLIT